MVRQALDEDSNTCAHGENLILPCVARATMVAGACVRACPSTCVSMRGYLHVFVRVCLCVYVCVLTCVFVYVRACVQMSMCHLSWFASPVGYYLLFSVESFGFMLPLQG
jgi:hypothetical protein